MAQSYPLRHMSRARSPHHGILERLLQRTMYLIADLLNRRLVPHDQRFAEIGLFPSSAGNQCQSLICAGQVDITVSCIFSSAAALASISRQHPQCQGRVRNSSLPCEVPLPICLGNQGRQNRSCYTHTGFVEGLV